MSKFSGKRTNCFSYIARTRVFGKITRVLNKFEMIFFCFKELVSMGASVWQLLNKYVAVIRPPNFKLPNRGDTPHVFQTSNFRFWNTKSAFHGQFQYKEINSKYWIEFFPFEKNIFLHQLLYQRIRLRLFALSSQLIVPFIVSNFRFLLF